MPRKDQSRRHPFRAIGMALILMLVGATAASSHESEAARAALYRDGRDSLMPVPAHLRVRHDGPTRGMTVYLNGNGARLEAGADDAAAGVSSLLWGMGVDGYVMPRFRGSDREWAEMVTCVRELYSSFDVNISDVRPDGDNHSMVVIGGRGRDLGYSRGVVGSSPYTGDVIPGAVAYVFDRDIGDARLLCEAVAHEIGHTLGLDHAYLCEDVMSYLSGCGDKHFVDEDAACGEDHRRDCYDDSPTQNSFRDLMSVLGPSDGSGAWDAPTAPDRGDRDAPGWDDDRRRDRGDEGDRDRRGGGYDDDGYDDGYDDGDRRRPERDDDDGGYGRRGDGDDEDDGHGDGYGRGDRDRDRRGSDPAPGTDDDGYRDGGGDWRPRDPEDRDDGRRAAQALEPPDEDDFEPGVRPRGWDRWDDDGPARASRGSQPLKSELEERRARGWTPGRG